MSNIMNTLETRTKPLGSLWILDLQFSNDLEFEPRYKELLNPCDELLHIL